MLRNPQAVPYAAMQDTSRTRARLLGLAAAFCVASSVSGQVVLSPVAVVGSDLGTASDSTPLARLIDQSGLETPFISGVTAFATYFARPDKVFATSGTGGTNNWQSAISFALPLKGYIDFDLGAVYRLDKIALWNQSLKDVTVNVRKEINGPEAVAGSFSLFSRLNFVFSYAVDVLSFPTAVEGRYVRLVVDSVHTFSPTDTFGFAIAGEVALSAAPVGKPPSTLGINLAANGDVVVTFAGVLQAATDPRGPFLDVPGNPQSPYIAAAGSLAIRQFYRVQGN